MDASCKNHEFGSLTKQLLTIKIWLSLAACQELPFGVLSGSSDVPLTKNNVI